MLTLILGLSFGCQEGPSEDEATDPIEADKVWQGLVSMGAEAQTFRLCESGELLWIVDESAILYQRYDSIVQEAAYHPVFAELRGSLRLAEEQETAGGEDKEIFMVEEIVSLEKTIPDTCRQYVDAVYTAMGSDPAWELSINPYAKRASFVMSDAADTTYYNYRPSVEEEEQTIFRLGAADTTLTATFTMEPCQHGSQTFTHTVEVEKGENTYQGCAYTYTGVPSQEQPEM